MCYVGWIVSKSHSEAQKFCQQHNQSLASFISQENINYIKRVIQQMKIGSDVDCWTGLMYIESNDTWSFVDGADTTFAVSNVTRPQNIQNDKCVMIHSNGHLSVTHCTEIRPFVCQGGKHSINLPIATSTGQ